jgi:hypothetical protein
MTMLLTTLWLSYQELLPFRGKAIVMGQQFTIRIFFLEKQWKEPVEGRMVSTAES